VSSNVPLFDDIVMPGGPLRLGKFDADSRRALFSAVRLARQTSWDNLRSPHIFMGLLDEPDGFIQAWGDKLKADLPRLLGQFMELFQGEAQESVRLQLHREFLSDTVLKLLRDAWNRCRDLRRSRITTLDLLASLFGSKSSVVADCFERVGITPALVMDAVLEIEAGHPSDPI
jgi:ATP-dependent Clp protease ATP-binding subunit ClpA